MKKNKKYLFLVCVPLFICVMILKCLYVPIDSDYSNLVLEANDILHGNIFLKDWNQTGISFLTTDLIFFVIAAVFGGVSEMTYYIAIGLMISTAIVLGFLLCQPSERTKMDMMIYVLLCSLPCGFAISVLRAHTGAICWVFLCILLVDCELKKHNKWNLVFIFISIAMGCMGDIVTLLVGALPLLLYCVGVLCSKRQNEKEVRPLKSVAIVTTLAVIAGMIMDKLYYYIGGANKNNFLGNKMFEPLEKWGEKFQIYIQALFLMEDASFFGGNMISIKTLGYFVNTIIILVGFVLTIKYIWEFISGKERDIISTLLSIGIIIVSMVFIITNVSINILSSRYIAYIPIAFSILIVRNRKWLCNSTRLKTSVVTICLLLMGIVSFGFKIIEVYQSDRTQIAQKELGVFLKENELKNGYGGFWNASSTTVLSNNRVSVRAIIHTGQEQYPFEMYNWFCKNSWYEQEANFIVTTDNDDFGITKENVIHYWGEPTEILEFKDWKILVYDKDLSQDIGK